MASLSRLSSIVGILGFVRALGGFGKMWVLGFVPGFGLISFLLHLFWLSRTLRLSRLRFWSNLISLLLSFVRLGWLFFCRSGHPVGTPDQFPGVMQTVQRAEFWGAIIAMQAFWPCHSGIDNLDVARTIGRLLDKDSLVKPLHLVKDGGLIALVQHMIRTRGRETVRVTKAKGHAEDADVHPGRVRLENQLGNAEADTAAGLGNRHQSEVLIDAWRG